jgi:hypothetical protein
MSSKLHRAGELLSKGKVCNPNEGDYRTRKRGKDEFYNFVKKTYRGLYQLEARGVSGKPTIGIFCRLDIGIISVGEKVDYFVSEVERSQNTGLWNNQLGKVKSRTHIGLLSGSFGFAFHKWLSSISSPFM